MTETGSRLSRVQAASVGDKAYEELRNSILHRKFAPGDKLVIDQLSRELGISLGPVREALARLLSDGMVEFERNKGYRVSPPPQAGDVAMWQSARLVIECGTVELAAALATPADIDGLKTINDEIRAKNFGPGANPIMEFMDLNRHFHNRIFEIAANPVLKKMYSDMNYGPQVTRQLTGTGVDDKVEIVAEHESIITALAAADGPAANKAMRAHILQSLARAFEREAREQAGGEG